jgi:hypothetical protein
MHLTDHTHDVGSGVRDRPEDDIEVTPEMIEAGISALYDRDNDPAWCSDEERIERIFRAMIAAKSAASDNPRDLR